MLIRPESLGEAAPIWFAAKETWPKIRASLPEPAQAFAAACGFEPTPGRLQILPGPGGELAGVLFGIEGAEARARDLLLPGQLAASLPSGLYRFANQPHDPALAALSWLLSGYRFRRYKANGGDVPRFCLPDGADGGRVERIAWAVALGRDLINTPANDMDPDGLEEAVMSLAARHHAKVAVTRGDQLLEANLPLIHAAGRAAEKPPRLADFSLGDESKPKVTLVGKGVCFDSGGLDIKPESGMSLMKKDMGGAAAALALASMIMDSGIAIRLRVLIPIVENAISGNAMRPGDIYKSHKGLSVEIGNTDAEGRLILADALALADEEAPELLVDFATLTGAARVALGPDLPDFSQWTKRSPPRSQGLARPRRTRFGGCPYGTLTTDCLKAKSPISTIFPVVLSQGRSPRRSSCAASSSGRCPGRISIFTPGRRRQNPAAPKAPKCKPRGCSMICSKRAMGYGERTPGKPGKRVHPATEVFPGS